MPSAADVAIRGLATYRLTRLIMRDEITEPIRNEVWRRLPPERSHAGYLLTCEWCLSIWTASALQISRIIAPKTTRAVESVLAFSAITGLLTAHEDR